MALKRIETSLPGVVLFEPDVFGDARGFFVEVFHGRQLFIPAGFAHGFCVVSDEADVLYQCSDYYSPEDERGILWSDPDLGIRWPVDQPTISKRDGAFPTLAATRPEDLPSV